MDESTRQHLLIGREHFSNRDYAKAEPLLREVLEKHDRFADVHVMLGTIAHAQNNLVAAEYHYERALALNPKYTEAALNLAVTYNDRGKYEAARTVYERIQHNTSTQKSDFDPFALGRIANMHAEVARAYADIGLRQEAIYEYERAVAVCPQFADLRTQLATLLHDVDDWVGARGQLQAALALKPDFIPALLQLGITLMAIGDREGAESNWRRVQALEPSELRAKMYLRMLATTDAPPKTSKGA